MGFPKLLDSIELTETVFRLSLVWPLRQRWFRTYAFVVATSFILLVVWTYHDLMPVNFERLHSPEVPVTYDNLASTPKLGEVVSGEEEGVVPGNSLIPQKIWQIMVNNDNPDPEILRDTKSWLARNIDYE
jgi:mannosyltransferase OCH1-like enzyme